MRMNNTGRPRYRVVTVIEPPFVMYNETSRTFYGYCIDLLNNIQSLLDFDYDIRESFDKSFGHIDSTTHRWTGVIHELLSNTSDIAFGPMWITGNRQEVIDFTIPYYRANGFSIMMKKPDEYVPFFTCLTILEFNIWCCFGLAFFLTSILLYIFERYTPSSHKCKREKRSNGSSDRFTSLKECFWYTGTSITSQGGGDTPKNLLGKLTATTWWLFAFVIVAAYTANLAGFKTLNRLETYIESLDDLKDQYQIEYSTLAESNTQKYFRDMCYLEKLFHDIWQRISLNESLSSWERIQYTIWDYPPATKYTRIYNAMERYGFIHDIEQVVKTVRKGNRTRGFAFIGEALTIRYLMLTNCGFREVGEEFSKKPFGIAVQKRSPLKKKIDDALTTLMLQKKLDDLEKKWWDENPSKAHCPPDKEVNAGFGLDYMAAVFLLIFLGIILAALILVFQYFWYKYLTKQRKNKKIILVARKRVQLDNAKEKNEQRKKEEIDEQCA